MKTQRNWLEDGETDIRRNRHKQVEAASRRKRHKEKLTHDISLNSEKLFLTQNVMIMMPPVLSS